MQGGQYIEEPSHFNFISILRNSDLLSEEETRKTKV